MKIIFKLLAVGLLIYTPAHALEIGAQMPSLMNQMKGIDGKNHTLASVKGEKGTLVVFTCNHCPWVVKWEDRIAQLAHEYAKQGVGVVLINPNDPVIEPRDSFENMKKRAAEIAARVKAIDSFSIPYVVDATQEVARAFKAEKTPEIYLFDAAGKLVYTGATDDNADNASKVKKTWLKDALTALVAGQPIKESKTRAIGCTIKWSKKES